MGPPDQAGLPVLQKILTLVQINLNNDRFYFFKLSDAFLRNSDLSLSQMLLKTTTIIDLGYRKKSDY